MSVDFNAVAVALAVRFGPTIVSAPSGEANVVLATSALPDAIVSEPTVLVFPPTSVTLSYGPGSRQAIANYPVRFYIYKVRDNPRNATLINKWLTSLYAVLDGQVHLGMPNTTDYAVVREIRVGPLTYADTEYHGIELTAEVHLSEGMTPQG